MGLEPMTSSLPRKCSTTELQQHPFPAPPGTCRTGWGVIDPGWRPCLEERSVERVKGIEPSCAAWKAAVLPLNYTRFGCTACARRLTSPPYI